MLIEFIIFKLEQSQTIFLYQERLFAYLSDFNITIQITISLMLRKRLLTPI